MFSFLSNLVPKRRDDGAALADLDDEPRVDHGDVAVFVPPAPLAQSGAAEPVEIDRLPEVPDVARDAARELERNADDRRAAEDELIVQQRLAEERLAARRERDRLVEERIRAEEARLAEEQKAAAAQTAPETPDHDERAEAERAEVERAEAERAEAERREAERREAERREAERREAERREAERAEEERRHAERAEAERREAERRETERREAERAEAERRQAERAEADLPSCTWPATLLKHEVAMNYGAGVRRNLLSLVVQLQDAQLLGVLEDALYEERPDGLRPDVLAAMRDAYHGEALRPTYERFARIGCEREREIARAALLALDAGA